MRLKATLHLNSPALLHPELLRSALERVVQETAHEVERDVKVQMRQPKHGRTYARGALTRRASKTTRGLGLRERTTAKGNRLAIVGYKLHRASAPGESPASDLGELIASLIVSGRGLKWTVGSPLEKAALLEGGTLRIAARPAFGPAAERAQGALRVKVDTAVGSLL